MHHHPLFRPEFLRGLWASALAFVAGTATAKAQEEASFAGKVVVLAVSEHTLVEAAQIEHLGSSLERVEEQGAAAVVLEIESPGGLAIATRRTMERLGALEGVKTFAFVKGEAAGGAAMVALATDAIYFSERGVLGSTQEKAIDWRGRRDALPDRLVDKTYADYADAMERVVIAKGRDGVLIDGFIDPEVEVKIGDKVVSEADDVLVLKAGSPVAAGTAESVEELCEAVGVTGELVRAEYSREIGAVTPEHPKAIDEAEEGRKPEEQEEEEEVPFGVVEEESLRGKIVVIEVGKWTLIRKSKFDFMKRILQRAVDEQAEAVIFEMNTPGGDAYVTQQFMLALQVVNFPTYTFVNVEASSAGSMIAIATDKIYMHKPSTIGSAAVVSGMGEEIEDTMKEKIESKLRDVIDEVATENGYDPEMCKAFVELDHEYYATIPVVDPDGSLGERTVLSVKQGELLSFSSNEAMQLVDGRPLFGHGTVQSIEELVEREGLRGEIVRPKPLGFEAIADFIVMLAPLLLLLALAGLYIEANTPGIGLPGILSLVMLAIFFFGHNAAGKLAGYEVIAVFLLGIVLLILELFVMPGVFILGAIGLLMIVGSLLFAMVDKFDFRGFGESFDLDRLLGGLGTPMMNLLIAMGGAAVLVVVLMRYLPEMPLMQKRMLVGVSSGGGSKTLTQTSSGKVSEPAEDRVGLEGVAQCDLRPAGKGVFGDRLLDVTALSEFVPAGTPIKVVKEEGPQIVVEKI